MIKLLLKIFLFIILGTLSLIGIYYMFNGGITKWGHDISSGGFFESIGLFFKEIWTGFRATCGF